ncbi:MAG TPA: NAD(P)-dependent oxidoreductase [Rectinemataceae bacterium]
MKILITGGFGNVGRSAVAACLDDGHEVTVFDTPRTFEKNGKGLKALIRTGWRGCRILFGDIRKKEDLERALASVSGGPDAVIHLAALIPPVADRDEALTESINVGGTLALLDACASLPRKPKIVFASSIAIYGDRISEPWISTSDPVRPNDLYARTKAACEEAIRSSGLEYSILRLSYVVWAKWFPFDPLLYSMPLATKIEIIHTEDAGRAFAKAAADPRASGKILDIGGGAACRTSFDVFLERIFFHFGLGGAKFLPRNAFASSGFHCGWYADSDEAEALLGFRRKNLEDFYEEVRWEERFVRPFARLVAPSIKRWLVGKSPRLAEERKKAKIREGADPKPLRLSRQERR